MLQAAKNFCCCSGCGWKILHLFYWCVHIYACAYMKRYIYWILKTFKLEKCKNQSFTVDPEKFPIWRDLTVEYFDRRLDWYFDILTGDWWSEFIGTVGKITRLDISNWRDSLKALNVINHGFTSVCIYWDSWENNEPWHLKLIDFVVTWFKQKTNCHD